MKYILLFYLLLCSCVAFTGCQDNSETLFPETTRQIATFTALQKNTDVSTRATDQKFETGDEIGIYIVKRNGTTSENLKSSGNYADNKRYIISENGNLQPYSESDKIYFSSSEVYDIYAYYPYNPNIDDPTNYYFTVQQNQSGRNLYTKSDLMTAKSISNSNTPITLSFERRFALVEIYFSKVSDKTVSSANLNSVNTTTALNLGTNTTTPCNNISNIRMFLYQENTNYYVFRAIVPVQELRGNYLFAFVVNGETIQYKAKSITPLAAGKKSIYTLNLQYYIKALARDANTGNITGGENGIYNHGETVNLTAIPAPGYEFKGWYESINGIWQSNLKKVSAIPHYEFSASKNIWLIAVFEESGYTVSLTSTTGGTNKGTGTYKKNTLCTLEAIPAKGYTFGGWYDENNKLLSKELTFSFTVMSDRHFSNNFIPNDNIITVWRDLYITVTAPKYKYKTGETCTLTATMYDKNYAFNGYYEDKECTRLITKSHIYSFIVDESRTIYTQNRDLTHFHFNRSFWFNHGMLDAATTLIENTHEYPAYTATLKAGEKARFESTLEFIESPEDGDHHQNTTQITSKVLTIKQNGRVIATISKPDNYIFTAPTAGTYEFIYTGTSKCTIFRGEKCVGYFLLKAVLWKEETLN